VKQPRLEHHVRERVTSTHQPGNDQKEEYQGENDDEPEATMGTRWLLDDPQSDDDYVDVEDRLADLKAAREVMKGSKEDVHYSSSGGAFSHSKHKKDSETQSFEEDIDEITRPLRGLRRSRLDDDDEIECEDNAKQGKKRSRSSSKITKNQTTSPSSKADHQQGTLATTQMSNVENNTSHQEVRRSQRSRRVTEKAGSVNIL
jgi:hypothetical protein